MLVTDNSIEEDHSGVGIFIVLSGFILLVTFCRAVAEFLGETGDQVVEG